MPQRARANLINSLSGYKSANVVGTSNGTTTNLAIVSSVVHIGANPPLMGMIMRPHTVVRDTLANIKQTGVYTINHVGTAWVDKAHQTSARYPADCSEFEAVGLTPWYTDHFSAPFVAESEIKIGLKKHEIIPLTCNNTELVIGEIEYVFAPSHALREDGSVALELLNSACVSGLDTYHSGNAIARFEYAKPDQATTKIDL